jgi:hypothetical protein
MKLMLLPVVMGVLIAGCGSDGAPAPVERLSATGLYVDTARGVLADGVRPFRPQYELWSDGATKRRWLWLPPGTRIDTSNMDAWTFPVGTKVWKEFTRDGVRVETRLLRKDGPGSQDWTPVAYVWNADQSDAVAAPDGQANALGTPHDVPDAKTCRTCHSGAADTVIGVSAIQLDHELGDLNLAKLAADSLLTAPPSGSYKIPGNDLERAALGYIHANCGNCHNERALRPAIPLRLALEVGALGTVKDTTVYKSAIGTPTRVPQPLEGTTATKLIVPGDPDASLVYIRMKRRAPEKGQMPQVGTELVDTAGSEAIAAWIRALPP